MTSKPEPKGMQKCVHSIMVRPFDINLPPEQSYCILEFHTAVDNHGRVIHQDAYGNKWS